MLNTAQPPEKALLVQIQFNKQQDQTEWMDEFKALTKAAGAIPIASVTGSRTAPEAKYYIGRGKLSEIHQLIQSHQANLVLFNHELSSPQKRNLEKALCCRVLDRTELVLDIFAQRARSFEGKLQVSLAKLQHLSTRLIRGWTHLERQQGGIGARGPGETQLETDRRLIRKQIKTVKAKLEKVNQQRQQNRRIRNQNQIPLIALVGYTNSGKSTLFNALTGAKTWAANQLFATLDPLLRRIHLPNNQTCLLADTVGFIRQLPHDLIQAFKATLEETCQADLILHVVDASDKNQLRHIESVQTVLKEIKADHIPQILVYNKIDCLKELQTTPLNEAPHLTPSLFLSSKTGQGIEQLYTQLMHRFKSNKNT